MTTTCESVTLYANNNGLTSVQIDGIPEGFSFKKPDVQIGEIIYKGKYITFIPLSIDGKSVECDTEQDLLRAYKINYHGK